MNGFETTRLKAQRLSERDLPDLVRLHLDEEVSRYLGGVRSPEASAEYLKINLRHWADHNVGLWSLSTDDGAFVGRAGLRFIEIEGLVELEIAYTFVRSAWGKGFATEIAAALVDIWSFSRQEPSLVGVVVKENRPSMHVLLKSGFTFERDAVFHGEACEVFRRCR